MIYMDNGATTRICDGALEIMNEYHLRTYGNPSASYRFASAARAGLDEARSAIAGRIGALPEEICFTSGGTEGNNLAIAGCMRAMPKDKKHLILSSIEHSSVLGCAGTLQKEGFCVSFARCDEAGEVKVSEVEKLIRPDTALISVMYANNEVGTINDVQAIGSLAHERGILFHTDAVAAAGYLKLDVQTEHIDLMTLSAHKFHGPKGAGFLYVREGTPVAPLIYGGSQERGLRSGTENVPAIMGMARAYDLCQDELDKQNLKIRALKGLFLEELKRHFSDVKINGSYERSLPGTVHFSLPGMSSDRLIMYLDMEGIMLSSGAACNSRDGKASHVLRAMGLADRYLDSSIRATLSAYNTKEEITFVVSKIDEIYKRYANGT